MVSGKSLGQYVNVDAFLMVPRAYVLQPKLLIPQFHVKNVAEVLPDILKMQGIEGVIFDKDNTLTVPYGEEIHPSIKDTFDEYKKVFGEKIAIMSNSAGTRDDKDYEHARRVESALGINVLRHDRKKPGGIEAVAEYFECGQKKIAVFGDRLSTDIVFGNRYGMYTVLVDPFTTENDNKGAIKVRGFERGYLTLLQNAGFKPKLWTP